MSVPTLFGGSIGIVFESTRLGSICTVLESIRLGVSSHNLPEPNTGHQAGIRPATHTAALLA